MARDKSWEIILERMGDHVDLLQDSIDELNRNLEWADWDYRWVRVCVGPMICTTPGGACFDGREPSYSPVGTRCECKGYFEIRLVRIR